MRFKRILLKLSGESLAGDQKQGINVERLNQYAEQIKEIASMGVQISYQLSRPFKCIRCYRSEEPRTHSYPHGANRRVLF